MAAASPFGPEPTTMASVDARSDFKKVRFPWFFPLEKNHIKKPAPFKFNDEQMDQGARRAPPLLLDGLLLYSVR